MKNVIRLTTVIALFFVATISAANTRLDLTANEAKSLTFSLDTKKQETTIRLIDAVGNVIYSEDIANQEKYVRRFDLNKLENGSFTLKVENRLREITYSIELGDADVVIKNRKENAKPVFRKTDTKVFLNLLNLEKKMIKIKIVDSLDRVVFEETIANQVLVEKAFNFEDAFEDTYQVVVSGNGGTYYENITIK